MFVRTVRMNTLKLVGIALLAVFAIAMLFIFIPKDESTADTAMAVANRIDFGKMESDKNRAAFLSQFGYTVDEVPIESVEVTIPDNFDKVFAAYNELQKSMGLDLGRYKGKKVMRYTYKVTNYEGYSDTVYANLLVYKNKIIGGDVCSADPNGFAWIDPDNAELSICSYRRIDERGRELLTVINFTPVRRTDFLLAVPNGGAYEEVFNSDAVRYGGAGDTNTGRLYTEPTAQGDYRQAIRITLPASGALVFRCTRKAPKHRK